MILRLGVTEVGLSRSLADCVRVSEITEDPDLPTSEALA